MKVSKGDEDRAVRDAVICEPLRTAVGRYGGVYKDVAAAYLAATVVGELMKRTAVPPELVDDVLLGQCYPNGEAPGIGHVAALDANLPVTATGYQIDRRCGSELQSIINASMHIQTAASNIVLAGGVESMSQAEYYTTAMRWGPEPRMIECWSMRASQAIQAEPRSTIVTVCPGTWLQTHSATITIVASTCYQ